MKSRRYNMIFFTPTPHLKLGRVSDSLLSFLASNESSPSRRLFSSINTQTDSMKVTTSLSMMLSSMYKAYEANILGIGAGILPVNAKD